MVMRGILSLHPESPAAAEHSSDAAAPGAGQPVALFRYADAALPDVLAIAYSIGAYVTGWWLLGEAGAWFIPGVLLLAHSMVIAAFLLHECTHGSLFARPSLFGMDSHLALAGLLGWLTGSCYSDFSRMREKHLRHHFERVDMVAFNYRELLDRHPLLRKLVETGQWSFLPAVEILFHLVAIAKPLRHGDAGERRRVMVVLALRALFFVLLVKAFGWQVLFGYCIAYLLFLTLMGFMDAFQHQYLLLFSLDQSRQQSPVQDTERFPAGYFSREYEQRRTFSNLVSQRLPWLNLLVLNFCYHNAHHHRPSASWWHLPALHEELVSASSVRPEVIPFAEQLKIFFRCRVERVMATATDSLDAGRAPGAAGVSFLTPL